MIAKILGIFILLFIIPLYIGKLFNNLIIKDHSFAEDYILGNIIMWAVFQIVAVPFVYLKKPFMLLFYVYTILMIFLMIIETIINIKLKRKIINISFINTINSFKKNWVCTFLFILIVVGIGYQMSQYMFKMHIDNDDSRFVVSACDAYDNNEMFTINHITGVNETDTIITERDLTSPWSMYQAWQSKVVHIYPTIMCHTILPPFLVLMGYCVFWILGKVYFKKNHLYMELFVLGCIIFNIYFNLSVYTASTFFLIRIWQGKAIVAGIIIPLLLYYFYEIFEYPDIKSNYILLTTTSLAACLLSGAAILIVPIVNGAFSIAYSIIKKRVKILLYGCISLVPPIGYGLFYIIFKY